MWFIELFLLQIYIFNFIPWGNRDTSKQDTHVQFSLYVLLILVSYILAFGPPQLSIFHLVNLFSNIFIMKYCEGKISWAFKFIWNIQNKFSKGFSYRELFRSRWFIQKSSQKLNGWT